MGLVEAIAMIIVGVVSTLSVQKFMGIFDRKDSADGSASYRGPKSDHGSDLNQQ